MKAIKIAPSILSADFARLADEIARVEGAGVDMWHVDVMDGHFAPNITLGPVVVEGIKRLASVPLDVHLMIENPERYIEPFADVMGDGDSITFHIEVNTSPETIISLIRERGLGVGIALCPATSADRVEDIAAQADMILVMTVNPGFSGQKFMPEVLPKIKSLGEKFPDTDIEVDGGINSENVKSTIELGANIIVSGSTIFRSNNVKETIRFLRLIP